MNDITRYKCDRRSFTRSSLFTLLFKAKDLSQMVITIKVDSSIIFLQKTS
jgi:hypothetical protein